MGKKILVPLSRDAGLAELVPFVEKIAQPGMKVVFLVPWLKDRFSWFLSMQTEMETGTGASLVAKRMAECLDIERRHRLAETEAFRTCGRLQKNGVEVAVDIYTDSLRNAVDRYAVNGDVQVIMMPSGIEAMIMKVLHGALPFGGLFGPRVFSPVLVFHQSRASGGT